MEIKHRIEVGKLLWHLGMNGDTAEVGAAEMLFTCDMLRWGFGKHYIIDLWGNIPNQFGDASNNDFWHQSNYESGLERIKEFGDRAIVLRGMSVDMAKNIPDDSLICVNIDCDHSFEGCYNDANAYWSKLKKGGVMFFHDFLAPEYQVKEAVEKFCNKNSISWNLIPENKPEDAGCWIRKL
jgi:hypothetical protein